MFRSMATVLAATALTGFLGAGIASAVPDQSPALAAVTQQVRGGDGDGVGGVGPGGSDVGVGVGGLDASGTVGVGGLNASGNEGTGVGGL
ncbi:hypothetical protein [Streptomyces broussonetiae]|uniref:DUF320 domain-containing protein n=1 Tax=Streptomyces broussonetiae TaxID=2686304 RepID=A0A6I6MTU9_9ACTN|nr:hypothetical protein [Streptomyces broussonetiae]QHA02444.1 hypothetical protein GQF42_03285 [Streptomyces broussonetiae]QHA08982.1 hypothetical protein GQF42_42260 [Streptomyces broussonetiae]